MPRRRLRETVEQYLRDRQIPYVDVEDAKRALATSTKLGAFHFVAFAKNGANWLVWAAQMRPKVHVDMEAWEKVFGEGFVAAIAKKEANGKLRFRGLDGAVIEIE